MGITGLIPFLEKAIRKIHLRDIKGSTVGIDTYCWLHKGATACAYKLLRGDTTDAHIKYCLKYVNLLLNNGIRPVLVFDGRHLPAKELTDKRRRASRKEAKEKAKELLREGKLDEARSYILRGVNITHAMAYQLIQECRKMNVDCIVAPYEADGQLGYLARRKMIDYVITEDSDMTLFGCEKVIFKLDLKSGTGDLFEAEHLPKTMGCREEKFAYRRFEMMAILSGCDYLDSLRGVGLVKACKFVLMTEETDVTRCLKKIPQYLNLKGIEVDEEYIEGFLRAMFTFRHMIVYDPTTRKQVHLTEPEEENLQYCNNAGEKLPDDETAYQLAIGNLDPFTLKQIDTNNKWDPSQLDTDKYPSIWGGVARTKAASNVIITVNKTNSVSNTAKRKIHKPPPMSDDEEKKHDAMNTSVDIMNKYLDYPLKRDDEKEREKDVPPGSPPDAKKIRLSNPPSVDRLAKNPFLKKKVPEDVKAEEEEKKMHFSLLQQANTIKSENVSSKFKKTFSVDKKVSVVSRFFSPKQEALKRGETGDGSGGEEKDNQKKQENGQLQEVATEKDDEADSIHPEDNPEETDGGNATNGLEEAKVNSESDPDFDSEPMDCSAFVEAEYSALSSDESEMQRENEQSPVPWSTGLNTQDLIVQDTIGSSSQLSDKENDKAGAVDSNNNQDNWIVLSEDEGTPLKQKKKSPAKKMPPKNAKQTKLMSFFQKKGN